MDVRLPDGTIISNVPDDIGRAALTERLQRNGYDIAKLSAPAKPFGQQMNEGLRDIPRQVGLTARYGIEGVGDVVDMAASPFRAALNTVLPEKYQAQPGLGGKLADAVGLPKPANGTERAVGDAARTMASAALPMGIAGQVQGAATGVTRGVAQALAANPLQQLASAGAAGGAGGYTRETGGDAGSQFVASLAAGVAAPMAINAGQRIATSAGNAVERAANRLTASPAAQASQNAQIDIRIDRALQESGLTFGDLPANIQNGIRNDVAQALNTSGEISPAAVRRLADYRLTNTTPTAATLTLDPAAVSQQKNLAKLGINSRDAAAQRLGQVQSQNNNQLISGLNDLGGNTPDTPIVAGRRVMNALADRNAAVQARIDARYDAARATDGRAAALDPSAFTQQANNLLDDALLGGKLPADVRNLLNRTATGEMPLTVDVAEQFKTRLGVLQRATNEPSERMALGLVRQALDDTPLLQGEGQEAINAFNRARRLNRTWMWVVENTPALQAVRDGVEPDKFVQHFIVGNGNQANVADMTALRRAVRSSPEALDAVRGQIVASLKQKALNGAADEVGNFSQSAYNKALRQIGEEKLGLFFQPEEINQLRAIGRVASYEQFQPSGSAVNNSNTAGAGLSAIFDRIASSPLLNRIPLGNQLAQPAQNISVGIQSAQALNVPNALAGSGNRLMPQQPRGLPFSPAMLAPLTGEDRDRRNSLLP